MIKFAFKGCSELLQNSSIPGGRGIDKRGVPGGQRWDHRGFRGGLGGCSLGQRCLCDVIEGYWGLCGGHRKFRRLLGGLRCHEGL